MSRFISSYRGSAEYSHSNRRFEVRSSAFDGGYYNPGYFESGILPLCGCIYFVDDRHEYVPHEIADQYPQYVRAKWDKNFNIIRESEPVVVLTKYGHYMALHAAVELASWYYTEWDTYGLGFEHLPLVADSLMNDLRKHLNTRGNKKSNRWHVKRLAQALRSIRNVLGTKTLVS